MNRKTVVELDLVGYSDTLRIIEENLGVKVAAKVNAQIQGFVDAALEEIGAEREQVVLTTTGDGAILAFEKPDDAHNFALKVHDATEAHNAGRTLPSAQRWFRIGIATGEIFQETRSDRTKEFTGTVIANAVRLEAAARPGEILVDAATFSSLLPSVRRLYGPEEKVKGKRTEKFAVHRYCAVPSAAQKESGPSVRYALELLDHLKPRDQLNKLMQHLDMPIQHRPSNTLTLFERQDAIVDWAASVDSLGKLTYCLNLLLQRQKNRQLLTRLSYFAVVITVLAITAFVMYSLSPKASAEIRIPVANDHVDAITSIRGTSKNIGAMRTIWVVIKSGASKYYSHASGAHAAEGTDEWSSTGCVGPREDFDKEFEILAVGADEKAQAFLQEEGRSMCAEAFSA
jgi:class 3 adenylate cyclase